MFNLLTRHSFVVILLAVFLEEMGIPMPIPTDILIVFAGAEGAHSELRLALWFGVLNLASAVGASVLYAIVRRGGKPLVDRFGRYVHLGPDRLARGEALLKRSGWTGIAVGRAIPGLRYVTVIACGLLNIPYLRFITAHLVGSSIYITVFLFLGAHFGPAIADQIHAPEQMIRLIWLLALAVGLPLLLMWFYYRSHAARIAAPSRWRAVSAMFVASFAGATALAATWATATDISQLMNTNRQLNIAQVLTNWLQGRGMAGFNSFTFTYTGLLILCIVIGIAYYDIILPWLAPKGTSMPRQVLGLAVLTVALVACFLIPSLLVPFAGPVTRWWRDGGVLLLIVIAFGITSYALTTVYGRALAIAVLPSLRRAPLFRQVSFLNRREMPSAPTSDVEQTVTNSTGINQAVPLHTDPEQS